MQIVLALALSFAVVDAEAKPERTVETTTETKPETKPEETKPETKSETKTKKSSPPLQEAEAALRAGIHKRCIEFAQEALATGQLEEDGVARAWWTRGRCHSIDGDKDRAVRSYAVAVRVKPNILMPVTDSAFDQVKAEGTAAESALVLDARTVVLKDGAAAFVAVEVSVVDDLALGRTFLILDSDDRELARAPIERKEGAVGDEWTRVNHRFSGIPVEKVSARLLDKNGNVLRRAPVVVDDAARAALVAAGATPTTPTTATTSTVTWLSYVGGGTAALGIVGASASGIALAISTANDGDHVIDSEVPLVIGFAAGFAVAIVGGALVVADQGG